VPITGTPQASASSAARPNDRLYPLLVAQKRNLALKFLLLHLTARQNRIRAFADQKQLGRNLRLDALENIYDVEHPFHGAEV
jgi:hypothetical protein